METLEYLVKLFGFLAIAITVLYVFVKIAMDWTILILARPALQGKGGPTRWMPHLAAVAYAGLALMIAESTYPKLAPTPAGCPETAGLWDGFLCALHAFCYQAGYWLTRISGPLVALLVGQNHIGAIQRRRTLQEKAVKLEVGSGPAPTPTGRRIVICCDGTSNRPDQTEGGRPATTNIDKIYRALQKDERQIAWYDAGVGSDTSTAARRATRLVKIARGVGVRPLARLFWFGGVLRRLVEAATGTGVTENIVEAYTILSRHYRPGDQIFLFGFSRGAWTARCLAGVIGRCGILKPANIRYAADVVYFYRKRGSSQDPVKLDPEMTDRTARVAFLGVFDTVASLGLPLWGWWFNFRPLWRNQSWSTTPVPICDAIYHAVAMDERRSQFFVTLFDQPDPPPDGGDQGPRVEQMWFRGNHGDVGGGYADTALSDIALKWMMDQASAHSLVFATDVLPPLQPNPLAALHNELDRSPAWRLFGSWPRWHPVQRNPSAELLRYGTLHSSVHERADALQDSLGQADLLVLADRDPPRIDIDVPGNRTWHRTGLVLQQGRTYRMTWLDGVWRDQELPPCGPQGQEASDVVRRLFGWTSRVRGQGANWMTLIATVAHPRAWPLQEYGLGALARVLLVRDPPELTMQLAPVGRDLAVVGDYLFLRMDAPDGLLWLFANDAWLMAGNNSGSVRLRVEQVDEPEPGLPLWTISREGEWRPPTADKMG